MKRAVSGVVVFCFLFCGACGDDDDDGGGQEPDGGTGGEDAGAGDAGDAGTEYQGPICGDGVQEGLEQCDDGNFDDQDGCNSLCEFSCETDDDCSDLNPCNGSEQCTESNACESGDALTDGAACGNERSCWNGLCLSDICGDGTRQGDEECDDGNLDADDGCTPDCLFTCLSTDDSRDCSGGDECAGATTCDDDTHTCGGTPLPDRTDCTIVDGGGEGWCMKGVCVPPDCGDGTRAGAEQCDAGEDNGEPGSGCSIDCKTMECGNGKIEASEQCDDGNQDNLDGCDFQCGVEIMHRMTRMDVLKEPPPDFCEHDGNRFGEAFPGPIDLTAVGGSGVIDFMQIVNDVLNGSIVNGEVNVVHQMLGSSDPSLRTSDDEVWVAIYRGQPAEAWQDGPPIDFPFQVEAGDVDENNQPLKTIAASQRGGGPVATTEPVNVAVQTPIGELTLFDMRLQIVYDVASNSSPAPPPELADSVEIPETVGRDLSGKQPYRPAGRMCGATSAESLNQIPWNQQSDQCCPNQGGSYTACQEGDEVGVDCSSFLDLIRGGCSVLCLGGCTPGCGFPLLSGIEPDVDMDGDGVNDAFSVVLGVEGRRVRVTGVAR